MVCPEDHIDETLRGKTVNLRVKLNKISREILPELDEEFAKKVGFPDLESLKKMITDQANHNKVTNARAEADIQHIAPALCKHALIERVHHGAIARERIAVVLVRKADTFVIAVGPEVETGAVQHISSPFRSAGGGPARKRPRRLLRRR